MSAQRHGLAALRNIGPATARQLVELGIADEAALRRFGPVAAYRRLKFANPRGITLVALYALHGALTDTHWAALPAEVKDALRREAESEAAESGEAGVEPSPGKRT